MTKVRSRVRRLIVGAGRAIGLYALGGLAPTIVGFLALPVFTRIFSPDEFGVIGLFTASVGLLSATLGLGGHLFIIYDRASPERRRAVPPAVIVVASAGAVAGLLIGLLLVIAWSVPPLIVFGTVVASWANTWILIRLHTYQARDRPGAYFLLAAAPPVAAFAVTVLLAEFMDGWAPRLVALVGVALLGASWSARSLVRSHLFDLAKYRSRISEVVRFGAPLLVHTASVWAVGFTDRFFVAEILGLAPAGIYTVAYSIGVGASMAHDGVSRFFSSRLPEWLGSASGRISAARFAYTYVGVAVLSIPFVVLVARLGLRVLASDAFAGGADLLFWLIPAQTLAGTVRIFSAYLYVERRTRERAVMSALEALVNVALTWWLVSTYGMVGAAVATFATYFLSFVGSSWLVRSRSSLPSLRDCIRFAR